MRTLLTLRIVLPNGHTPVTWSRGQNVGVGGRHLFCQIAPGEPVRRATQAELRRLTRIRMYEMIRDYPTGTIQFDLWRPSRRS